MSRIGKKEIIIPNNTKIEINQLSIQIKGQKGQLFYKLPESIKIIKENNKIKVIKKSNAKKVKQLHGLSRSIINNMIIGVSKGFEKKLIIQGVGYRSQIEDKKLILNVGYSHPVIIKPPDTINIKVENNTIITVSGIDKGTVGQISATIRNIKPPEPYKGKGIKYENETIRRKVGKAGK
uniref:Large ribosomal subunit protein uL6c n=1 Tax=Chondria tumulosa TaxID=2740715 RepID=A0A896SQP8_9FLOR|nr:ribosomal protein L6 [Chondria tumulosa]QSD57156.1 ribosomal protein L6 [Chondria tumulosa]